MNDQELIHRAYEEFMQELFGEGYGDVSKLTVDRSLYTKKMHEIQDKYGLKQGHPAFVGWLFTLIGQSPMIREDEEEEGAGHNESTATN